MDVRPAASRRDRLRAKHSAKTRERRRDLLMCLTRTEITAFIAAILEKSTYSMASVASIVTQATGEHRHLFRMGNAHADGPDRTVRADIWKIRELNAGPSDKTD